MVRAVLGLLLGFVFLFWLAFPWHLTPDPENFTPVTVVPNELANLLSYERGTLRAVEIENEDKGSYLRKELAWIVAPGSNSTGRKLSAVFYSPEKSLPGAAVLVVPILGGNYGIASIFCRYLAENGIPSLFLRRSKELGKANSVKELNSTMRQLVIDQRLGLDWLQGEIRAESLSLGILGISMGGVISSLVTAVDKRLKASVMIMAGSNLPEVLMSTKGRSIAKMRDRLMKNHSFSPEELLTNLRENLRLNPTEFSAYVDPKKVLMFMTIFDRYIPFSSQRALRKELSNPEAYIIPTGHYSARIYLKSIKAKSLEFLRQRLQKSNLVLCHSKRFG
jgi:dienelactone hydrolase